MDIKFTVDGKEITATAGATLLDACLDAGLYIPHLCSHPDLNPIGACGLCVVEIEGRDELISSCITEAEGGMVVRTKSAAIDKARLEALQRKLAGHPADCDSCNKYLNCELQSLKQYIIGDESRFERRLRNFPENSRNPIFIHNPTKCIQCGRCVRACHELRGIGVLYFKARANDIYVGVGNAGMENAQTEVAGSGGDGVLDDTAQIRNGEEPYAENREIFNDLNEAQQVYIGTGDDLPLADAGCRFCGACAEVCPTGAILDRHEFGEQKSKREALLPCVSTCPAGIDIPRYIRFLKNGDAAAAVAVIREKVPFPLSLGYVCSRPCEGACRRGEVNEAISIRDLKRYAAERNLFVRQAGRTKNSANGEWSGENETAGDNLWKDAYQKKSPTGKRIAIVGGGPAGLSAAYYLTTLGHEAVVFETMPEAGGMLRYGIPEYRLPTDILAAEVADIRAVGANIRVNTRVTSIKETQEGPALNFVTARADNAEFQTQSAAGGYGTEPETAASDNEVAEQKETYDAILLAIGTTKGTPLRLRAAQGSGVLTNTEFLRAVRLGMPPPIGDQVIVLGGGNVAFDCARVAKRLGARETALAFLEPRDGMTASEDEITQAIEEGILLYPSVTFTKILREEGTARITGVQTKDVESFSFEDGQLELALKEDSERVIPADTVIFAVGQKPEVPEGFGPTLTDRGLISIDSVSLTTDLEGVFAAGDAVSGTDSVVGAVARARATALKIDKYLGGRGRLEEKYAPDDTVDAQLGKIEEFAKLRRAVTPLAPPEARAAGFGGVELPLSPESVEKETQRCLQCDMRLKMSSVKFWGSY